MHDEAADVIIEGLTEDGARFRPSDWVERLIGTASTYGHDRRQRPDVYAGPERRNRQIAFLHGQMNDGIKCLMVDGRLRAANPEAFAYVMEFARSNKLRWRTVR
jgi:hypothetical protein